jgi:hypothetical protein
MNTVRYTVATSILAEGADLPSIESVIIVGGAFGGIIAVAQMMARAGRGLFRKGQAVPRAYLLHSLGYCEKLINKPIKDFEEENLSNFPEKVRPVMKALGSLSSPDQFFSSEKLSQCPTQLLSRAIYDQTPAPCGQCCRCDPRQFEIFHQLTEKLKKSAHQSKTSRDDIKVVGSAKRYQGLNDGAEVEEEEEEAPRFLANRVSKSGQLALNELNIFRRIEGLADDLTKNCILCRSPTLHYPNDCPMLTAQQDAQRKRSKSRICKFCFGEHDMGIVELEEEFNNLRSKSNLDEGDLKRLLVLIKTCPHVNRNHPLYDARIAQPCPMCWIGKHFESTDGKISFKCLCDRVVQERKVFVRGFVRACVLKVWYDLDFRNEFFAQLPIGDVFTLDLLPNNFVGFVEWAVYGRGLKLQNAFRVLDFILTKCHSN